MARRDDSLQARLDRDLADLKLPEKYKDFNMSRAKPGITAIYSELK